MAERRSLIEGLSDPEPPLDQVKAREFLAGANRRSLSITPSSVTAASPLSTRIRADYAEALKHASLDRQLKGIKPNTIRDILEEVLGPWLKTNDYIS